MSATCSVALEHDAELRRACLEGARARGARARAVPSGSEPLPLPRPSRDLALHRRQHAEGVRWKRFRRDENPGYTADLRYLIAAVVHAGSLVEARTTTGDLMRLEPEVRLATFARRRQPFRQPETGAIYLEGLRGRLDGLKQERGQS
jgi:hypothetical protein